MKHSTLNPIGKRIKRRLKARLKFRAAVLERSKGFCDRCGIFHGNRLDAHHYRPRSLGGSDDPRLPADLARLAAANARRESPRAQWHEDGNGVALCPKCHHACHMRQGEAAIWIDSHNRSLLLERGAPPARGAAGITNHHSH